MFQNVWRPQLCTNGNNIELLLLKIGPESNYICTYSHSKLLKRLLFDSGPIFTNKSSISLPFVQN